MFHVIVRKVVNGNPPEDIICFRDMFEAHDWLWSDDAQLLWDSLPGDLDYIFTDWASPKGEEVQSTDLPFCYL